MSDADETARSLDAELDRLARHPQLVVASDFDGTLSPIAPQPEEARPHPGARLVLEQLAALPSTHVAVVSGRSLVDLDAIAPMPASIVRIGSHGLESSAGVCFGLDARAHLRLNRLVSELQTLAEATPGSRIEVKPFSVAFHYRHAEPERAQRALAWIDDTVERRGDIWRKPGHKVVELLVLPATKSWAIDVLRDQHPGSAVFYVGDDVTDEDVFNDLRPGDVGCKVGDGPTAAAHRVPDPDAVVALLSDLARRRAAALGVTTALTAVTPQAD
ncbi:MAG TPA: trehalose-phosphatase [Acidimicrobiales bacterium]